MIRDVVGGPQTQRSREVNVSLSGGIGIFLGLAFKFLIDLVVKTRKNIFKSRLIVLSGRGGRDEGECSGKSDGKRGSSHSGLNALLESANTEHVLFERLVELHVGYFQSSFVKNFLAFSSRHGDFGWNPDAVD